MSTDYVRRADYEVAPPQDMFIVSLLNENINEILSTYAKSGKTQPCVLDVGCGSQPFRKNLEMLGYKYTSLDAEQNQERTVDIVCLIDKSLPSEIAHCEKFDFILCTEVMEHVADWHTAFSNLVQLLAPEGRLFITCPYIYQLHEEPYDYWRPTPYAFQYFAEKYQLKIICQSNAGDAWDVLGTVLANFQTEPATDQLPHRILNKLVSKGHQILLNMLLSGRLQNSIKVKSKLYQSNIVVFEK